MKTETMMPPVTTVAKYRFTTDRYYKMVHAGVLHEHGRVELIKGDIIDMAPVGGRHATCVSAAPGEVEVAAVRALLPNKYVRERGEGNLGHGLE